MWSLIHSTNTERVPDTILRAEVTWDGDRPVYLSSQANKINNSSVSWQGRLLYSVTILNSVATKKDVPGGRKKNYGLSE